MAGAYIPVTGQVTVSSSAASAGIPLEPTARSTTLLLVNGVTSSSTAASPVFASVKIEVTLDTWVPAGVTQTWMNASSIVYSSSQPDGAFISILGPIAGARLNSSAYGSSAPTGTFTLKSLQSVTAGP